MAAQWRYRPQCTAAGATVGAAGYGASVQAPRPSVLARAMGAAAYCGTWEEEEAGARRAWEEFRGRKGL